MNICMITSEFPPVCAGIGNYVYNLSKCLKKKGHDITILTRGNLINEIVYKSYDELNVWQIRFSPLYPYHVLFHGLFLNKILSKTENKFDIIHLHNPLVPFPKTSLPVIVTEHGTVLDGISNSLNTDISTIALKLFANIFSKHDSYVLNKSDFITPVSKSCMEDIRSYVGEQKKIQVVGNGVDTHFFNLNKNINRKKKVILYTGRLDSRKGIIDLINSGKIVCEKYPDVKYLITGKGANEAYLRKQISNLNLNNNISLIGYVSRDDLLKLYQTSTIYVLPSYYEGLPTTLLEAMACGLPSIATNVKGNNEVITHGSTGILVPPHSPNALGISILDLLENHEKRDHIGRSGMEHVKNNYSWSHISDKFEYIYQTLIFDKSLASGSCYIV